MQSRRDIFRGPVEPEVDDSEPSVSAISYCRVQCGGFSGILW